MGVLVGVPYVNASLHLELVGILVGEPNRGTINRLMCKVSDYGHVFRHKSVLLKQSGHEFKLVGNHISRFGGRAHFFVYSISCSHHFGCPTANAMPISDQEREEAVFMYKVYTMDKVKSK